MTLSILWRALVIALKLAVFIGFSIAFLVGLVGES